MIQTRIFRRHFGIALTAAWLCLAAPVCADPVSNFALLPLISATATTSQDGDGQWQIAFATGSPPAPIDLTGITFALQWHPANGGILNPVVVSLSAGQYLTNGGPTGVLSLTIPQARLRDLPTGTYTASLVASLNGATTDLGPITITHAALGPSSITAFAATSRNAATATTIGYVPGPSGLSAYQVALANGYPGTQAQWLASLVGPPGATGGQGLTGAQGSPGPTGPPNTLAIGTVATGTIGGPASATITGTAPSQTLNLTLPFPPVGNTANTVAAGNDSRIVAALQSGNNLTDLASIGVARTNLGLGTLATQNAASVAITGGSINGTPIGGTTAAAITGTTITAASLVGPLTGNALTASALVAARSLALSGDVTGSTSFDGSANVTIAGTLAGTGVSAGTYVLPNLTFDTKGRATAASNGALTGDVTTPAGTLGTTISANAVTNAKLAQAPAGTLKGNTGTSAANVSDYTPSAVLDAAFGSTQGSILYRGSGAWSFLGPGTSGQYLATGGTAANPSWSTPSGAGNVSTSGTITAGTLALFASSTSVQTATPAQARVAAGLNATGAESFRNRIINGAFTINQRAVATASTTYSAGAYTFDRWKAGSGNVTASFSTAASGDGTASITAGTLAQVIEGPLYLPEGGTYVASWSGTATCRFYQGTATGSYVAAPLAITGITSGTNGTLECSTGTLSQVQLEPGTLATAFERRDDELRRGQRYYEIGVYNILGYGAATNGYLSVDKSFKTLKRAVPTIIVTTSSASGASGTTATNAAVDGFLIYTQAGGVGTVQNYGTWTAGSEL